MSEKTKKIGRPPFVNPEDKQVMRIGIRMSKKTMNYMKEYCKKHDLTISEVTRQGFNLILHKDSEKTGES